MRARIGSWLVVALLGTPIAVNAQSSCSVTAPANGTLGTCTSPLPSGHSCTFACNEGYEIIGTVDLTCNNGVLSGQESCVPASCSVTAPTNGTLGTCSSTLASGSECQFTCNSGYFLNGADTSCTNGVLTAQTCTAGASCSVTAPTNGYLGSCPTTLSSGGICQFQCASGYSLSGTDTSCTNGVLTAQTCTPSSCPVTAPTNGTLGTCSSTLASGSECQFACNSGYTVSGTTTSCTDGTLTAQTCAITQSSDTGGDGPIPLWALAALAAGLILIALRRMKKPA
jgi:hypothetical protein